MAYDRRPLIGVGGWLAVFIVTLCFDALASIVMSIRLTAIPDAAIHIGRARSLYLGLTWLMGTAKFAGYSYIAWRIAARREPSTPRLAIIGLWTLVLAPPLIYGTVNSEMLDLSAIHAIAVLPSAIVRPAIFAAIWTAYLFWSERVANTYMVRCRG